LHGCEELGKKDQKIKEGNPKDKDDSLKLRLKEGRATCGEKTKQKKLGFGRLSGGTCAGRSVGKT